jgi:hypothetical protein
MLPSHCVVTIRLYHADVSVDVGKHALLQNLTGAHLVFTEPRSWTTCA